MGTRLCLQDQPKSSQLIVGFILVFTGIGVRSGEPEDSDSCGPTTPSDIGTLMCIGSSVLLSLMTWFITGAISVDAYYNPSRYPCTPLNATAERTVYNLDEVPWSDTAVERCAHFLMGYDAGVASLSIICTVIALAICWNYTSLKHCC